MVYNNGFPVGYPQPVGYSQPTGYSQQYYQQPYYAQQMAQAQQTPQMQQMPQPQPQVQQVQTGRILVQGEEGAKNYLVAPNCSVDLWDSDAQVIYAKSADASGMPNTKIIDYQYRDTEQKAVPVKTDDNYATKEDIDNLRNELKQMKSRLDNLSNNKKDRKDYNKNEQ